MHTPPTAQARAHTEMETVHGDKIILGLKINLILFYIGKVFFFLSTPFYLNRYYPSNACIF